MSQADPLLLSPLQLSAPMHATCSFVFGNMAAEVKLFE